MVKIISFQAMAVALALGLLPRAARSDFQHARASAVVLRDYPDPDYFGIPVFGSTGATASDDFLNPIIGVARASASATIGNDGSLALRASAVAHSTNPSFSGGLDSRAQATWDDFLTVTSTSNAEPIQYVRLLFEVDGVLTYSLGGDAMIVADVNNSQGLFKASTAGESGILQVQGWKSLQATPSGSGPDGGTFAFQGVVEGTVPVKRVNETTYRSSEIGFSLRVRAEGGVFDLQPTVSDFSHTGRLIAVLTDDGRPLTEAGYTYAFDSGIVASAAVPEPASWVALALGGLALLGGRGGLVVWRGTRLIG